MSRKLNAITAVVLPPSLAPVKIVGWRSGIGAVSANERSPDTVKVSGCTL